MLFCKCGNMLYMKIDKISEEPESENTEHKLLYYCKACGEKYDNIKKTTDSVYSVNFNIDKIKKKSLLNKYTFLDPTLPKANGIKCPNKECPSKKESKPSNIVYINYDNKNMLYVYCCLECKKAEIEPNIW